MGWLNYNGWSDIEMWAKTDCSVIQWPFSRGSRLMGSFSDMACGFEWIFCMLQRRLMSHLTVLSVVCFNIHSLFFFEGSQHFSTPAVI